MSLSGRFVRKTLDLGVLVCLGVFMDEPLMTPEEVQKLLNITPRQLRYLREKREIPFIRVGSAIRFKPSEVQGLLAEGYVGAR